MSKNKINNQKKIKSKKTKRTKPQKNGEKDVQRKTYNVQ